MVGIVSGFRAGREQPAHPRDALAQALVGQQAVDLRGTVVLFVVGADGLGHWLASRLT